MSKSLRLLISVILSCFAIISPAMADTDTSWVPFPAQGGDLNFHAVYYEDSSPLRFDFSLLQGGTTGPQEVSIVPCKAVDDPKCAGMFFIYNSILKVCNSPSDIDCIVSLEAVDSTGKTSSGTFSKYTVDNHINAYPAYPAWGIPAGGMPSVWSLPSAPHASGSDYVIEAGIAGQRDSVGNVTQFGDLLSVTLKPVVLKDFGKGPNSQDGGWNNPTPGYFYDACGVFQQTPTHTNVNCGHVNGDTCLYPTVNQGLCYVKEEFATPTRFKINLRLSKEPNGWLHGRMTDPNVSITREASGAVDLSVEAGTSSVPKVYQGADWPDLTNEVKKFWVDCWAYGPNCGVGETRSNNQGFNDLASTMEGNAKVNLLIFPISSGDLALQGMSAITAMNGNKSSAVSSSWSFRSLSNYEMNGANKCFTNTPGIKGIVTTNSSTYSAGPPAFSGGALNYRVASPHFNPDGTTAFKGVYNLVMKSDIARCIYGFSKAPISATISVISSDGASDVATTVANEQNGWLNLSANNFEFSSPTIKVKLTQDAPAPAPSASPAASASPSPSESPAPTPTASLAPTTGVGTPTKVATNQKKSTITCIKGKTIKSVTAVKPTCPTGYKKK